MKKYLILMMVLGFQNTLLPYFPPTRPGYQTGRKFFSKAMELLGAGTAVSFIGNELHARFGTNEQKIREESRRRFEIDINEQLKQNAAQIALLHAKIDFLTRPAADAKEQKKS